MTTYHPSIPQASDNPSISQRDLLDNFGSLNTQVGINHVALTAGQYNGLHKLVNFSTPLGLTADPNLGTPFTSLYPKVSPLGTNELFFQNGMTPQSAAQLTNLPVFNGIVTNVVTVGTTNTISSPFHGLANGNTITIYGVYGATQLNGNTYTVANVTNANTSAGTFDVTQAGVSAYVSSRGFWIGVGGGISANVLTRYGMYTPWGMAFNFGGSTTNTFNYAIPLAASPAVPPIVMVSGFNSGGSFLASSPTNTTVTATNAGIFVFIGGTPAT